MKSRPEEFSPFELRSILENQYGIIFFPKRQLIIPTVTAENLKGKVAARRENTTFQWVQALQDYLHMPAIGDNFGAKHSQRIQCYRNIQLSLGKSANDFLKNYATNNQLQLGNLTTVQMRFDTISHLLVLPEMQKDFLSISSTLFDLLTGKKTGIAYIDLNPIQEKISIVHAFEDKIIEGLGKLAT